MRLFAGRNVNSDFANRCRVDLCMKGNGDFATSKSIDIGVLPNPGNTVPGSCRARWTFIGNAAARVRSHPDLPMRRLMKVPRDHRARQSFPGESVLNVVPFLAQDGKSLGGFNIFSQLSSELIWQLVWR